MCYSKRISFILFLITAILLSVPALSKSEITLPSEYNFEIINNQEAETRYTIELAGYTFQGQGIFRNGKEVILRKIWIESPQIFWYDQIGRLKEENKLFVFMDVRLSLTQGIIGSYVDQKECGDYQSGWILTTNEIILNNQGLTARGLIYFPMNYKGLPIWFTRNLDKDLRPETPYMYDFDYNFTKVEGPLHIVKSRVADTMIFVEEGTIEYTMTDGQIREFSIYNFYIDRNGFFSVDKSYHSEHYQITVGNINLDIPGVIPIFRGDNFIDIRPLTKGQYRSSVYLNPGIKVIQSKQDVLLDHIPADGRYLSGRLNSVYFETGEGNLEDGKLSYDRMSFVFSITDNSSVINMSNVSLDRDGFDFKNTEIKDPFFKINTLGYIQVTGFNLDNPDGITMKGILTVGGETATALSTYSINDPTLQPFLLTGDGIDSFTMKVPETEILCYKGWVVVSRIRWEPKAYNDSFKLILEDAKYIYEDDKGRVVTPLGDSLTIEESGKMLIQVDDRTIYFGDWISERFD